MDVNMDNTDKENQSLNNTTVNEQFESIKMMVIYYIRRMG